MKDLFSNFPYNGEPPAQSHSATSKAAAAEIKQKVGPLHRRVLNSLREDGPATDEELCFRLHLGGNTLRPRRRELQLMGRVKDSGKTRPGESGRDMVIWELTTP